MGGRWGWGGGWGDGFAVGGEGLHELDAGAVGVEEVELALAVDAGVWGEGLGVGFEGGAGLEGGEGGGHVWDLEGDVVAAAVGGGKSAVEHEFDVVGSVGDAEVDPTELGGIGGAAPGFLEAEDAAVEIEGALGVSDEEADVVDVLGDARGREEFAGALGFDAGGLGLGEFDWVPSGSLTEKTRSPVLVRLVWAGTSMPLDARYRRICSRSSVRKQMWLMKFFGSAVARNGQREARRIGGR